MATRYSYPIGLHEERKGGYSVTFPDFDEAFTDGDTLAEAVAEAADCLEEALAGRIARREDIPAPSPARSPRSSLLTPARAYGRRDRGRRRSRAGRRASAGGASTQCGARPATESHRVPSE